MKIQSFYIFKLPSKKIISNNFNIDLTTSQARKNGMIVSIAENQAIRSLFHLQNRDYDIKELDNLFQEKKKIKNKKSSSENIKKISEIEKRINEILFIPEFISVVVNNKRHYSKIIQNSFWINGIKYVRLMCGAGHSRRNTVIFCSEEIFQPLKNILDNNRNPEIEISPNKYNAYFALSFSGTIKVSDPYFTVIPDLEITRKEQIDYVVEKNGYEKIEQKEMPITFNVFDGMGLISIQQAKKWSEEIGLNYIPSTFIVRNSFIKGMVAVMDFHRFSDEMGIHMATDIYGNTVNIRDMDLILTKSMFKGHSFYNSLSEYIQNCKSNYLYWGISRYAPEKDQDYVFSNYQFNQNLNLNNEKIEKLCQSTIDYFDKIIKKDIAYTLLYLLGKLSQDQNDKDIFYKIDDPVVKALILNNDLINDPYIQNYITHSLNKKIRESYIGNILLEGNYSTMIADPYALMEHLFNLPVKGLLNKKEHYSSYWLNKNVKKAVAMRAPLTWRSEVNPLYFKKNDQTNFWYQNIQSGIIYNIFSIDTMLQADSDYDGDLIMTTNNPIVLTSVFGGLPITYEKEKAPKSKIIEEELYLVDNKSFDAPIGVITNNSTTMIAMLENYEKDSLEYNELIERLKLCRFYQGQAIDAAKNTNSKKMPYYWSRKIKITDQMSEKERLEIQFNNNLVINKRPIFMRYMYSHLNQKYINHNLEFETFTFTQFNKFLFELLDQYNQNPETCTEDELIAIEKYYRQSPVIESNCTSNKICFYLENKIKEIKNDAKNAIVTNEIFKDVENNTDVEKLKKLNALYLKYKSRKRNLSNSRNGGNEDGNEDMFKTLNQYYKSIREEALEISSDIQELAYLALNICYIVHENDNKQFAWQIFGDGIIKCLIKYRKPNCSIPFLSEDGDIEYLGKKYKMIEIEVEKEITEIEDNYDSYF